MTIKYDINHDELVLLLQDSKYIVGYVKQGGYDTENPDHVKVDRDILPPYFFDDFIATKYLFYSNPNEVIENKNFIPPKLDEDEEGYVEETNQNKSYKSEETVPKEEYDALKDRMDRLEEMLQQLLAQKG